MSGSPRLDSLGMYAATLGLAEQVRVAATDAAAVDLPTGDGIESVVVLGMGGSGIGGDLTAAVCGPSMSVPVVVPKGYAAPAFVGPSTLVFASSFSGNTEETIEATTQSHERGARVVVLSHGGHLADLAAEWGVPHIQIQDGIPMPRAGIGAVSIPPLVVLERLGLVEGVTAQIDETVNNLQRRSDELAGPDGAPAALARRIGRTMPIVYGGGLLGQVAATRWKGQFNENPKVPSFANRVPELTHNEIAGWGQHGDVTRQVFSMILLRHGFEHPQTARRLGLVEEICSEVVADIHTVEASGESLLAQMFDLVLFGDLCSTEMAFQAGVDPGPVPVLDEIKARLKQ